MLLSFLVYTYLTQSWALAWVLMIRDTQGELTGPTPGDGSSCEFILLPVF